MPVRKAHQRTGFLWYATLANLEPTYRGLKQKYRYICRSSAMVWCVHVQPDAPHAAHHTSMAAYWVFSHTTNSPKRLPSPHFLF